MTTLLSIAPEPIIFGSLLAVVYLAGFWYYNRQKRLNQFRQNLRVGDQVTLLCSDGARVRARIVRRNSAYSFQLAETDNRRQHLTAVTFIYP